MVNALATVKVGGPSLADPDLVENYKNKKTATHKFGFFI
jgi:hypothetical protein